MENKMFFFTMKIQSSLSNSFGKEIATRAGFMYAENSEQAKNKIWDKYGSDSACCLEVWEPENSETESICIYYN